MDHHLRQQHTGLMNIKGINKKCLNLILQISLDVIANRCTHILVSGFTCTAHADLVQLL